MSGGREDGFALVEAIVAFMILVTALTVGVRAISGGTAAMHRVDRIAVASQVARELHATTVGALPGPGRWSGRHEAGARWTIEAAILVDRDVDPPLLDVVVDVLPDGARAPYRFRTVATGAMAP